MGGAGEGGLRAVSLILRRWPRPKPAMTPTITDHQPAVATDAEPEHGDGAQVAAHDIHDHEPAGMAGHDLIHLQCPTCQKRVKVAARGIGEEVECPGCAAPLFESVPKCLLPLRSM